MTAQLSRRSRCFVLVACFLALLFDGVELGLMPVASMSVSKSLMGAEFSKESGGQWFAWFTAALMLGAAVGGITLGSLGDRIGRTRAMGVSILLYSIFAALGAWARTQEQMLALRFLVGLGVGGLWPNAMSLVSECWTGASRPLVSGVMMAGLNAGIALLSQLARLWPITDESWRWLFQFAGLPAVLGLAVLAALPESPQWLASRGKSRRPSAPLHELFSPEMRRTTWTGILLSTIPMVGAWSASKWMIPWADAAAKNDAGYKSATQGWWALGAILGSIAGAQLAARLGRRLSYGIFSVATTAITVCLFQATAPLQPSFHPVVFAQGFVATLFFGWLAFYLPELFPMRMRAAGSGLAYNSGRFATAGGVLAAGILFGALGGDFSRVGAICAGIYALGLFAAPFIPDTSGTDLNAPEVSGITAACTHD